MEKVTANGFSKHGNHPLVKALQLLGVDCQVHHIPYGDPVEGRHVFIKRDPRNALIAKLRMLGKAETAENFISAYREFDGRPLIAAMAEFEGWLSDPDTYVVRYEDLIASDACMRSLADHLQVDYIEGSFEDLPGMTRTWTGPNHSDYSTIWTPEVEAVWAAKGGPELLARWGY